MIGDSIFNKIKGIRTSDQTTVSVRSNIDMSGMEKTVGFSDTLPGLINSLLVLPGMS